MGRGEARGRCRRAARSCCTDLGAPGGCQRVEREVDLDVPGRDLLDRRVIVAREEIRREVAAGDLRRWPPQAVGCDVAVAVAAGDRVAEVPVVPAGQEQAPEDRAE